jgi:hypothetical protein
MKKLESLETLSTCDSNVQKFMNALITATHRATYLEFSEPLPDYLGSDFFIVETEEDLKAVSGVDPSEPTGTLVSLADKAILVDDAELLRKSIDTDTEYVYLFLSTHDAGGESHFIPRALWNQNVLETYKLILQPEHDVRVISSIVVVNNERKEALTKREEVVSDASVTNQPSKPPRWSGLFKTKKV